METVTLCEDGTIIIKSKGKTIFKGSLKDKLTDKQLVAVIEMLQIVLDKAMEINLARAITKCEVK